MCICASLCVQRARLILCLCVIVWVEVDACRVCLVFFVFICLRVERALCLRISVCDLL